MGQYFLVANLDKKEYLLPHNLDCGLKFLEICASNIPRLLALLLRKSNETGGGDIRKPCEAAGRWAGDRIVIVGDYDESGLYYTVRTTFREISEIVKQDYGDFIGIPSFRTEEAEGGAPSASTTVPNQESGVCSGMTQKQERESDLEQVFGPVLFRYTAEDAVRDGMFVEVGKVGDCPVYFTRNLFDQGYQDEPKRKALVDGGLKMLGEPDAEDTDSMRLRVIEKDRIWVVLNGEGITFMKPEDY